MSNKTDTTNNMNKIHNANVNQVKQAIHKTTRPSETKQRNCTAQTRQIRDISFKKKANQHLKKNKVNSSQQEIQD